MNSDTLDIIKDLTSIGVDRNKKFQTYTDLLLIHRCKYELSLVKLWNRDLSRHRVVVMKVLVARVLFLKNTFRADEPEQGYSHLARRTMTKHELNVSERYAAATSRDTEKT